MKKRILVCILGALLIAPCMLAETTQTLLINGEKVDKVVSSITFDGDNVVLNYGNESESIDMSKVLLSLEYNAGINDLKMFNFNSKIEGGKLIVEGLEAGAPISVYSLNGVKESSGKADGNGKAILNIDSFPSGVYIMRSGNNFVKFVKR
ncbi:MAG: hypothetical protein J1F38_04135 [Muribaculaceae bacterium]|nr:hypothetical protein [Muribaculaceae bacterium]